MDPLVFMDFADEMNLSVMALGVLLFFVPFMLQAPMLSKLVGVEMTFFQTVIFMAYGASTVVGGFLQGEAEYLEYFVDVSAALGIILFLMGPVTGFLIGEAIWLRISVISLLFLSIPSTAASWYTRESVYEEEKY